MSLRTIRLAASALAILVAAGAVAEDARVLGDEGRVLTVGPWGLMTDDFGFEVRIADDRSLGWELRDEAGTILAQGLVPGSEGPGIDASPALSRDPVTGDVLLAWSRQADAGTPREISLLTFSAATSAWDAASLRALVVDADDQVEPVVVHDASGAAWISWIDGLNSRTVRFAGLGPDGRFLGQSSLSEGVSTQNGPPSLGIDAVGRLFVAYAGTPAAGGDVTLFVLTPNPIGGGVTHVPNPFIELGLRGTVPAPTIERTTPPSGSSPTPSRVHLTVLGGTPVAWWTESINGSPALFRYAAEGTTSWADAQVRALDLRSGMVASVPEALALVEARLRRVIDQAPGGSVPVVPPQAGVGLGRILRR
jgi:hypothetical protein